MPATWAATSPAAPAHAHTHVYTHHGYPEQFVNGSSGTYLQCRQQPLERRACPPCRDTSNLPRAVLLQRLAKQQPDLTRRARTCQGHRPPCRHRAQCPAPALHERLVRRERCARPSGWRATTHAGAWLATRASAGKSSKECWLSSSTTLSPGAECVAGAPSVASSASTRARPAAVRRGVARGPLPPPPARARALRAAESASLREGAQGVPGGSASAADHSAPKASHASAMRSPLPHPGELPPGMAGRRAEPQSTSRPASVHHSNHAYEYSTASHPVDLSPQNRSVSDVSLLFYCLAMALAAAARPLPPCDRESPVSAHPWGDATGRTAELSSRSKKIRPRIHSYL
jgi:hypothetical protein